MAKGKKRQKSIPNITITDMLLLRKYAMYLFDFLEETDLPRDVWSQISVVIEKLETLIRNGESINRNDLDVFTKGRRNKLYDERNILIFAMVFYRNREPDCDDYEGFVMRDLENKLGNPYYFKESRKMTPEWFKEMELKRQNRQLLDY